MNMIAFTKEIWKDVDIPACISREVGRNVMDVGFFSSMKSMLFYFLLLFLIEKYLLFTVNVVLPISLIKN